MTTSPQGTPPTERAEQLARDLHALDLQGGFNWPDDAVSLIASALTEAEARGEARGRAQAPVDNGNTFIFCDYVDRTYLGCVRGAGHNGPHVFSPVSQPLGPVLLARQPPPEGGVPSQAPDVK